MENKQWSEVFFNNFLYELDKSGLSPAQISKFMWKPFIPEDLNFTGHDRDLTFFKVQAAPVEISRYLERLPAEQIDPMVFLKQQKLVIVLLPGFTHHTLKYQAFIAQDEFKQSPMDIVDLAIDQDGISTIESFKHQGDGVKLAYVSYPRSNADPDSILESTFKILHNSKSLKQWVADGYKIIFSGYSYGAALAMELMSSMQAGIFADTFILENTLAFLSINGNVQGSYLADAVMDSKARFNIQKFTKLANKFPPVGMLAGYKNAEERDDLPRGVEALTHAYCQNRLEKYAANLPKHIKYFIIGSFLPEEDYINSIWKNFDDWTMYKQSMASRNVSVYNDGQMVFKDCLLPSLVDIPEENKFFLGAVRSNHWSVSFLTLNMGKSNFPRFPYYRALTKTLAQAGIKSV